MKIFVCKLAGWLSIIPLVSAWLVFLLLLFGCVLGTLEFELVRGGFTLEWAGSNGFWKLTV